MSHGDRERPCCSFPDPKGLAPWEHMYSVLEAALGVQKIIFNADFSKFLTSYFLSGELK